MKAIIWKELRENAKWAALALVAMLILTVVILLEARGNPNVRDAYGFGGEFLVLFASCIAAPAMGLLQTALEIRRDQWAFLMHRGVSATHIFLGKSIVGLSLYLVVMFVPLLLMATVYALWSPERLLFNWRMALPNVAIILAGTGLYFAAMLIAVRQARWYGSRLLPVVLPGLTFVFVLLYMSDYNEALPLWLYLTLAASATVVGLAARGAFIRSGESVHWPRRSKLALAAALNVAFLVAAIGLASGFVGLVYDVLKWQSPTAKFANSYRIDTQGHVLRVEYLEARRAWGLHREILSVVDLDEPASRSYAEFIDMPFDKLFPRDDQQKAAAGINELTLTNCWYRTTSQSMLSPPGGQQRLIESLNSIDRLQWRFSTTNGFLYAYEPGIRYSEGHYQPPSLKWIVGRDGFAAAPDHPKLPFGRLLTGRAVSSIHGANTWGGGRQPGRPSWNSHFLLFDDAMYEIDPTHETVRQIYAAPDGKAIRSVTVLPGDRFAVVLDDSIHIHRTTNTLAGQIELDDGNKSDLNLPIPGEFLSAIPIPDEVRPFNVFQLGEISDQDLVIFHCLSGLMTNDITRIVTMKSNGEVVQVRDLPDWPARGLLRESTLAACAVAAAVPFGFACVAAVLDAIVQSVDGTGPGLVLRLAVNDPLSLIPATMVMLALSVLSVALARRTARRYGFSKSERRVWFAIAFLLGPTGLLSLYGVRHWSARLPCHMCGEPRPVDLETCAVCGNGPEPVPRDGTEIVTTPGLTAA